jgi:polyferredoxin
MVIRSFPAYLLGFLGLVGLSVGRMACGWICPFGFLQDAMHRVRRWRVRFPRWTRYLKYAVLLILVLVIPYATGEHWFSKLCPQGALQAGIPFYFWNPTGDSTGLGFSIRELVGWLFSLKLAILAVLLGLMVFIKRPFCRFLCPLGAIYALFNRVSFFQLEINRELCLECGKCDEWCPVDLEIPREVQSPECIGCLECTRCEAVRLTSTIGIKKDERLRRVLLEHPPSGEWAGKTAQKEE